MLKVGGKSRGGGSSVESGEEGSSPTHVCWHGGGWVVRGFVGCCGGKGGVKLIRSILLF